MALLPATTQLVVTATRVTLWPAGVVIYVYICTKHVYIHFVSSIETEYFYPTGVLCVSGALCPFPGRMESNLTQNPGV